MGYISLKRSASSGDSPVGAAIGCSAHRLIHELKEFSLSTRICQGICWGRKDCMGYAILIKFVRKLDTASFSGILITSALKHDGGEMNRTSRRMVALTIVCALALAGVSCKGDKASSKGTANMTPEQAKAVESYKKSIEDSKKAIVAKVNGVNITMRDLIEEMNTIAPQYIKSGQERNTKVDEKVRKDALDRLIYRELAVQEATRQGIKVPTEAIADRLKKLKTGLKSEDAYRENLARSGLTEDELKKQFERNILVDMITEKEIFGKVAIDPQQVKKTYVKKKASYKGPSGQQMSLEEARPFIERELMTPAVHKREDEWVEGLKKAAKIEITVDQSAKGIQAVK